MIMIVYHYKPKWDQKIFMNFSINDTSYRIGGDYFKVATEKLFEICLIIPDFPENLFYVSMI